MVAMHCSSSFFNDGPTAHWVGLKILVSLVVEGREVTALANSSSQVNTMTLNYVKCHKFPVLPLEDLVGHPLNLTGLGGTRTSPMGLVILWVQVMEIAGYNEDVVLLAVPDELEFSRPMPLVLGMHTLCRIVNVIRESELNRLSTLWSTARTSRLLSRQGTADLNSGAGGDAEEGTAALEEPHKKGIDEPVMRESVRLGPFQMQILKCKTTLLLGETAHVMVVPLKAGTVQPAGACPLPPGFHVLHVCTRLKMGSNKVSVIVCNMSDSPIFLKKGV